MFIDDSKYKRNEKTYRRVLLRNSYRVEGKVQHDTFLGVFCWTLTHKQLILNWFEVKNTISLGAVEGLNNKVKVVTKKSYGFKTAEILKITLYHKMGKLPVPKIAHKYF